MQVSQPIPREYRSFGQHIHFTLKSEISALSLTVSTVPMIHLETKVEELQRSPYRDRQPY